MYVAQFVHFIFAISYWIIRSGGQVRSRWLWRFLKSFNSFILMLLTKKIYIWLQITGPFVAVFSQPPVTLATVAQFLRFLDILPENVNSFSVWKVKLKDFDYEASLDQEAFIGRAPLPYPPQRPPRTAGVAVFPKIDSDVYPKSPQKTFVQSPHNKPPRRAIVMTVTKETAK